MKKILIIYNVRSIHNVGSLCRSADGAGFTDIHLIGYTPGPLDRFGRKRSDFSKTALGAEGHLVISQHKTIHDCFDFLKNKKGEGYVVALEQHEESVDYTAIGGVLDNDEERDQKKYLALIVGNEVAGIEKELIESGHVDASIEIPMTGIKESLNVSVAGAIAMYEIAKYI